MKALPSARRLDYHYIAMQAGFWAMFAAICAYQAALLQGRGFSNGQVGLIIAVRCLAGIVCQPALGGFADRHPHIPLKYIVSASLGLSFVAGVIFTLLPMGMTAIICSHDQIANAVMVECQQRGYRLPRDISVIGFDDLPLCAYTSPPLTTIRQDRTELGKCGYYALDSILNRVSIGTILLHAQLVERESTGRITALDF